MKIANDERFLVAMIQIEQTINACSTLEQARKAADSLAFEYMRWSTNHLRNQDTPFLIEEYNRISQLARKKEEGLWP